jgi:hypothetical protein
MLATEIRSSGHTVTHRRLYYKLPEIRCDKPDTSFAGSHTWTLTRFSWVKALQSRLQCVGLQQRLEIIHRRFEEVLRETDHDRVTTLTRSARLDSVIKLAVTSKAQ